MIASVKKLEADVSRLTRVRGADTDKLDQVELEHLREFRQDVEDSLERTKNALPNVPTL